MVHADADVLPASEVRPEEQGVMALRQPRPVDRHTSPVHSMVG